MQKNIYVHICNEDPYSLASKNDMLLQPGVHWNRSDLNLGCPSQNTKGKHPSGYVAIPKTGRKGSRWSRETGFIWIQIRNSIFLGIAVYKCIQMYYYVLLYIIVL